MKIRSVLIALSENTPNRKTDGTVQVLRRWVETRGRIAADDSAAQEALERFLEKHRFSLTVSLLLEGLEKVMGTLAAVKRPLRRRPRSDSAEPALRLNGGR